jgi:uncharacterized protein YndB with AHSA1/START domain
MQNQYVTTAIIRASPGAVWRILTDSAGYAAWNPEILAIEGTMTANARLKARVRVGGGAIRTISLRVTAFEVPTRMEWTGGLPFGLFVGRRTLEVIPRDGGSEFRMHLRMTGPLAPLILKSLGNRQPEIDRQLLGGAQSARGVVGPGPCRDDDRPGRVRAGSIHEHGLSDDVGDIASAAQGRFA